MKKIILVIVIIIASFPILTGQEIIEKKFYKSLVDSEPVNEKRAQIVKLTIKEPDGTLLHETRELKSNKLLVSGKYKDGIPISKWLFLLDNTDNYLELKYENVEYEDVLHFNLEKNDLIGNYTGKFVAPIFPRNDNNFLIFISTNLRYPPIAADKGIQGQVIAQFILDESGDLINLSILKSIDPELDKEAARVISLSPDWIPAKLNGQPIRVHIVIPINFILK